MATQIIANNYTAEYFLMNDVQGQRKPISAMELSNIFIPESLGYVMAEEMGQGSILATLSAQQREFTTRLSQVMWKEEGDMLVASANKATYATNVFTVSPTSFPTPVGNMDTSIPGAAAAQWVGIHVGLRFTVFDSTGVQNWGRITAIAGDGKSFTAAATGAASFTVGASVEVMFTNYNLDHCECPPAIAIKNWAPTFGNTLAKDGVAVEYCAETMQEEGMLFDHIPTPRGEVSVDTRLNDALKLHTQRLEHSFAFDKQLTEAEATAAGSIAQGTNGVFTILEGRATKVQGLVEDMDDVNLLVSILKKNKIREATMHCTAAQFTALQALFPVTSAYHIDPFVDHENDLVHFGFAGFKINGVTIRFKEWSALDEAGDFVGLKYNFVIVPEGRLRRVINGQTENVGYLNAAYYTIDGKVMKMLRQDQVGNGGYCGVDKISYLTKVAPVLFMANKFILGVA